MRILMLGWEFPPFISGGLGTACYGLAKALSDLGAEILFVLPGGAADQRLDRVRVVSAAERSPGRTFTYWTVEGLEHVELVPVGAAIQPYVTEEEYLEQRRREERAAARTAGESAQTRPPALDPMRPTSLGLTSGPTIYAGDLFSEVHRYARLVAEVARQAHFDVIHAHDWMTFPAGLSVAALSGKPLVAHMHSTEFDRSGLSVNQRIYDVERAGLHGARLAVCVSRMTRDLVTSRYGVPEAKCRVIYNAITVNGEPVHQQCQRIEKDDKIVLFLGRITMQKGPEYFLAAAKKVAEVMDNVKFIMAGSGDMIKRMIELAAAMGIGHRVTFTGFLRGDDVDRIYEMADLYVMPSVSEPFGLAPLEALSHDVPVLISKQSGVSEVLVHALKVDFWDIHEMANKIIAVLRHPPLQKTLKEHGAFEVRKFSWADAARQCLDAYQEALQGAR
ncbi:MAG: glycosyltransferase family 4 protein [Planctomycetes bacterium]|nr:glycosyltransferase family 4 protein [Planctomycetota bacterium]